MPERRTTVVTGGASGIGQAAARRFARGGDFVVIADLNEEAGQNTVDQIREMNGKSAFISLDVTNALDGPNVMWEIDPEQRCVNGTCYAAAGGAFVDDFRPSV